MKIILNKVKLINPDQNLDETNDVLIENGIIKKIGNIFNEDKPYLLKKNIDENIVIINGGNKK